jgi:hypothetical protein
LNGALHPLAQPVSLSSPTSLGRFRDVGDKTRRGTKASVSPSQRLLRRGPSRDLVACGSRPPLRPIADSGLPVVATHYLLVLHLSCDARCGAWSAFRFELRERERERERAVTLLFRTAATRKIPERCFRLEAQGTCREAPGSASELDGSTERDIGQLLHGVSAGPRNYPPNIRIIVCSSHFQLSAASPRDP